MRSSTFLVLTFLGSLGLALLAQCAIPNIQQVRSDLKACADKCNATNDACIQVAQDGADSCLVGDAYYSVQENCVQYYQRQGTTCIHDLVACLGVCIGDQ